MVYFLLTLVVVVLDQATKLLVVRRMEEGESIPIIDGLVYLTSHRNAGAAFGILQNQRLFFIIVTTVVVIAISWYLWKVKAEKKLLSLSLALILGGALGNFIDRLLTGEVVDFVNVYIPLWFTTYNFPIFNVADASLTVGAVLLIIDVLREGWKEKKQSVRAQDG